MRKVGENLETAEARRNWRGTFVQWSNVELGCVKELVEQFPRHEEQQPWLYGLPIPAKLTTFETKAHRTVQSNLE